MPECTVVLHSALASQSIFNFVRFALQTLSVGQRQALKDVEDASSTNYSKLARRKHFISYGHHYIELTD